MGLTPRLLVFSLVLAAAPLRAAGVKDVPILDTKVGSGISGGVGNLNGAAGVGGAGVSLTPSLSAPRLTSSLIAPTAAPQVVPAVVSAPSAMTIAMEAPTKASPSQTQPPAASDPAASAETASSLAAKLFDGASAPRSVTSVVAPSAPRGPPALLGRGVQGPKRRAAWLLDGRSAEYLDGGGFKDVLIHPDSQDHLVTLFNQAGAFKPGGSEAERDREAGRRAPLAALGLAPRVVRMGSLEVSGRKLPVAYLIQERVYGETLRDAPRQNLALVAALFDKLVAARVRLEDGRSMAANIMVGRTATQPKRQAWVVDAGEAERAPPFTLWDKMRGRPDPLRQYYDGVLADLRRAR